MPLDKYKQKRNFSESPEPAGDTQLAAARAREAKGRTPRFFCVQKHLASHLHYDFRLEHNGVLLSWAVPKGPALDPATKRLAMHVEDHPVEYGDFEGVIPSGYGAGIVMLWDRGTWTPEVDDVDAALKKGDLKFTLNGFKLKGSWVLVRTKGGPQAGGDGRSWLLIKHKDEWAGAVDITEFAPLSVKGGGDFADILSADNPAIWESHRPASSGEAGAMFQRIIERALAMRAGNAEPTPAARASRGTSASTATTKRASTRPRSTPRAAAATKTTRARASKSATSTPAARSHTTRAKAATTTSGGRATRARKKTG
jgi:bifunctional non-homologous end joining protein LigD